MTHWCSPIAQALDRRTAPGLVFFRDDDAGWADGPLLALLDRFDRQATPIDLAVIPSALGPSLARELLARMGGGPGRVGVHQHGLTHVNHEAEGRKYEFGPSRSAKQQRRDIEGGNTMLAAAFGTLADPIFTPPWNRCTADTTEVLAELGFAALSRDLGAEPLPAGGLFEVPVAVDWCRLRQPGSSPQALARRIAGHLAGNDPCGIMLHHAVMDQADLSLIDDLLRVMRGHPHCDCVPMADLIAARRGVPVAPPPLQYAGGT